MYTDEMMECCTTTIIAGFPYDLTIAGSFLNSNDEWECVEEVNDYVIQKYDREIEWWQVPELVHAAQIMISEAIIENREYSGFLVATTVPSQSKMEKILRSFGFKQSTAPKNGGDSGGVVSLWYLKISNFNLAKLTALQNKKLRMR